MSNFDSDDDIESYGTNNRFVQVLPEVRQLLGAMNDFVVEYDVTIAEKVLELDDRITPTAELVVYNMKMMVRVITKMYPFEPADVVIEVAPVGEKLVLCAKIKSSVLKTKYNLNYVGMIAECNRL